MKIEQAIKEYLIEIEVRQYSPRTIKGYRNNLNLFLRFCRNRQISRRMDTHGIIVVERFATFHYY